MVKMQITHRYRTTFHGVWFQSIRWRWRMSNMCCPRIIREHHMTHIFHMEIRRWQVHIVPSALTGLISCLRSRCDHMEQRTAVWSSGWHLLQMRLMSWCHFMQMWTQHRNIWRTRPLMYLPIISTGTAGWSQRWQMHLTASRCFISNGIRKPCLRKGMRWSTDTMSR